MIRRRRLIASSAASLLAAPALVRAAEQTTLKFVPQTDLSGYDPVWSSAQVTRNYAHLVFDIVTLRPGLFFHDGEPVRTRDCAASLVRWSKRDSFGAILLESVDALTTPDDRTLRLRHLEWAFHHQPGRAPIPAGNGAQAWSGWPTSPRLEALRNAWLDAPTEAEQKRIAAEIQGTAFKEVPYVPLGQFFQPVAYRSTLSGIVTGFPIFWNVQRR